MSEKEERLYIVRYPSRLIPEATGITVTRKKFNSKSFTRAEAVDRMAEVIFQKDNVLSLDIGFDKVEQCTKNFYLELAEAALDALVDK